MISVEVNWNWKLDSTLHMGSGLSDPGIADRLVQLDHHQNPVLVGDAVKGALRMAAEQVCAWLGARQDYTNNTPAEPKLRLLALLFGAGNGRVTPGRLVAGQEASFRVVASTEIDDESGCAKDDHLRKVQVVDPGVAFSAGWTVWASDKEEAEAAATLMLVSLAAAESIGGKAGIGWGRVRPIDTTVSVGGNGASVSDLVVKQRLEAVVERLREESESNPGKMLMASKPELAPQAWRLRVSLEEPACLGRRPEVSNLTETYLSIPATTLRGALAAAWARDGVGQADIARRLGPHTRWSPAVPVRAAGQSSSIALPVPRSFVVQKGVLGLEGRHDTLREKPPSRDSTGEEIQWRSVKPGWMTPDAASLWRVPTATRMHVARRYDTGSKREGALFARQEVEPVALEAFVYLPEGVEPETPRTVFLGKRRSAGLGRAEVAWDKVTKAEWGAGGTPGSNVTTVVELLSPALVRGSTGHWLRTLDDAAWRVLLGSAEADFLKSDSRSTAGTCGGWMGAWGHARAHATCVEAGSVFSLIARDADAGVRLRAAVVRLQTSGLGARTHEGFGWIAVDPPWLRSADRLTEPRTEELPAAQRWPGCDAVEVKDLEVVLTSVMKAADGVPAKLERRKWLGPLQELARVAREEEGQCPRTVALLAKMAGREKSRAWEFLAVDFPDGESQRTNPLRAEIEELAKQGAPRLRFALEMLIVRCSPEPGEDRG